MSKPTIVTTDQAQRILDDPTRDHITNQTRSLAWTVRRLQAQLDATAVWLEALREQEHRYDDLARPMRERNDARRYIRTRDAS